MSTKPTLTVQLMHANARIAELERELADRNRAYATLDRMHDDVTIELLEAERLVAVHKTEAHNLRLKQRGNVKVLAPRPPVVRPEWMELARAQAMASGKSALAVRV